MKRSGRPRVAPVVQKDGMGCGIACVAFVCRLSYHRAKRIFSKHDGTRPDCYCPDMVGALRKAGLAYGWRRLAGWRVVYKDSSIVFVKKNARLPAGHYLVRWRGRWMDPWLNLDASRPDILKARAGYRKRLPGEASYYIFPIKKSVRCKTCR